MEIRIYVIKPFDNIFKKKPAGFSQPECVFKNGFQFHAHRAKDNSLSEKKKECFFNQKSQISEIFKKCILDTKVGNSG